MVFGRRRRNLHNKVNIKLEEYFPLMIIIGENKEIVEYITYSKNKTSLLEFEIGIESKQIKGITLILCKEFSETTNKLVVENYVDEKIIFNRNKIECNVFKTILYCNGARIVLSDKTGFKYVKLDKVYLGLSDINNITEICVCDMSASELEHLKTELEFSAQCRVQSG